MVPPTRSVRIPFTRRPMCLGPVNLFTGKHHNPMPDIWDYSTIEEWEKDLRIWIRFRLENQDRVRFEDGLYF
jgi:hypothetical protein